MSKRNSNNPSSLFSAFNQYQDSMRAIRKITNPLPNTLLDSIKQQHESIRAMSSITNPLPNTLLDSFKQHQESFRAISAITNPLSNTLLDSLKQQHESIRAMSTITNPFSNTLLDSLKSANINNSISHSYGLLNQLKIIESLNSNNNLKAFVTSFHDSDEIKEWVDNISNDLEPDQEPLNSEETAYALNELSNSNNSQGFFNYLSSLPKAWQFVILIFILSTVKDIMVNIASNLATPYVQEFIASNDKSKREKIKGISSMKIEDIELSPYRFVTTDLLFLREKPSIKSIPLDSLQFGQVVTVLSKERNWLEVTYKYDDGKVMQGWVFTRYTSKFKN